MQSQAIRARIIYWNRQDQVILAHNILKQHLFMWIFRFSRKAAKLAKKKLKLGGFAPLREAMFLK